MNPYQETTTYPSQPSHHGMAGVRPYQDPNAGADAEVDLEKYPEPKDSSAKIRGKSEILELIFGGLQQELIVAKGFYFFFYSAFGSLFPLMGVYFKQLGLNPAQAGILSGVRPLVEYLSAPFWVSLAERQNRIRQILLVSLFCWILFTFPLGSIQPEPVGCIFKINATHVQIVAPDTPQVTFTKREAHFWENDNDVDKELSRGDEHDDSARDEDSRPNNQFIYIDGNNDNMQDAMEMDQMREEPYALPLMTEKLTRRKRAIKKPLPGQSPMKITYAINYNPEEHKNWISPSFSNMVYKKDDVSKVFFLLLLLVIAGEALSSPSIVLADSAVLHFLGDEAQTRYGHQRMFGSVGWALAMFFVGIALDHSTFPSRKCTALPQEKNYTVCFAIFVVLMGIAMILAWLLKIPESMMQQNVPSISMETNNLNLQGFENVELGNEFKTGPNPTATTVSQEGIPHMTVFAQQNRKMPEWVLVLGHFKQNANCIWFLGIAWLMGIGIGLIFTFLFWHLQDFGGSPTLFGLASVINHISEIFAYFFSSTFIVQLGHVKVLCIGLLCNVLRFLYITILKNPWWVLPFEFVQGITHASVWAACSSYLAHNSPAELRAPAQSVLQGLHHGLGRGLGAVLGGLLISSLGSNATFRIYALLCLLALAAFAFVNFYRKDTGFISELPQSEDPHLVQESAGTHLAPHGVPGSIPRVHSNTRLDNTQMQYETAPTSTDYYGNTTAPPNPTNPFASMQAPPQDNNQQYFIR